jgi:thiol-disulfide isomerase/thioredoxin
MRLGTLAFATIICAAPIAMAVDVNSPVKVTIVLQGQTVPGTPKVVPADNTFDALMEKTQTPSLTLTEAGTGKWTCSALRDQSYIIGWITKPKGSRDKEVAMFGYCSEPFVAAEGLTVPFSPGMPATFEYDLTHPPGGVQVLPAQVFLLRETISKGQKSTLSWRTPEKADKPGVLKIGGIAAGTYKISAQATDLVKYLNSRTPALYEDRMIEIKPGVATRFEPNYPEIDTTVEPGDLTIRGTLYGADKKPLAGKRVNLMPLASDGYDHHLYYPPATTDRDGKFEFVGVRPTITCEARYDGTTFFLIKRDWFKGATSISIDLISGLKKLPIEVGKALPGIVIDWRDGGSSGLSDLAGKTVVIDVWATWCGPCREALPNVNALAAEFAGRSDVAFIALSIDYLQSIWEDMVDRSTWKALRHGSFNRMKNSYDFQVGIPYYIIMDTRGIVRAAGNDVDLRAELDRLLKTSAPPGASAR